MSVEVAKYLRFLRAANVPLLARAGLTGERADLVAAFLSGCQADDVQTLHADFHSANRELATRLLDDLGLRHRLGLLPLRPGERLVLVGDSITADRLGWAEQLAALLDHPSLDRDVEVVNLGLAGSTTHDTLERLDLVRAAQPTRVVVAVGTNDARRQWQLPDQRLVSAAETRRNLSQLRRALTTLDPDLIALTPPPVDESHGEHAIRAEGGFSVSLADVADVATSVRECFARVVELHEPPVLDPADRHLMDADGVHPTPAGHTRVLHRILTALTRDTSSASRPRTP